MKLRCERSLCLLLCVVLVISLLPRLRASAGYTNGYEGGMAGDDNGIYAHGIDLSNWQGHEVDFNRIKEQGYSFVILRAGFATTEDDTFEANYTRAKSAGLDVGVYDETGAMVTGRSAGPKETSYSLSALTEGVELQTLAAENVLYENGRYVIAYREKDALYALGMDGETVRLSENGDGSVTVSADLLWTPIRAEGGVLSLVNAAGLRLHLDSDTVRVGRGSVNAVVFVHCSGETYTVCLHTDRTRWLSFSDGRFFTDVLPCELYFFALVQQ